MSLDAAIPLQVQAPKPIDPLTSIAGLMNLRGQVSEIALRQAQAEQARQVASQNEALAQQKNRDLSDQNTLQSLEKDPEAYADIHSGDPARIGKRLGGTVQPKTVQAVQDYVNKQIEAKATLDKATLANQAEAHAEIAKTVDSLDQMRTADGKPDFDRINQLLPGAVASLSPQLRVIGIDPSQVPGSIHSEEELNQIKGRIAGLGALTQAALTRNGEQAKAAQAEATAAKDTAEKALADFKLNLMKGGTDAATVASQVDGLIDPVKFPQANKDAKAAAVIAARSGDPAKITEAIQGIYNEQVGKAAGARSMIPVDLEKQAAELPGEVKKAVAVENATSPIKVAEQVAAAKALRMGDNQAVAGVAPSAIQGVQEHAIKLDQEYAVAKEATDAMDQLIHLATVRNKAAGANLPLAGVGAVNAINGIKRINSAEIAQYGTAGSLLDEIKGKLGKWTEGQPIPKGVLADIKTLHDALGAQAYSKYTGELDSLNKRTGAQYKPTYEPPAGSTKSSGGHVIELNGKHYQYKGTGATNDIKNYDEVTQ